MTSLSTSWELHKSYESNYTGGRIVWCDKRQLLYGLNNDTIRIFDPIYKYGIIDNKEDIIIDNDSILTFDISFDGLIIFISSRSLLLRRYDRIKIFKNNINNNNNINNVQNISGNSMEYQWKCTKSWKGHTSYAVCAVLSHSGGVGGTSSVDGCVKVWDTRAGYCTHSFNAHKGIASTLIFDPTHTHTHTHSHTHTFTFK
eukprot:GHVR01141734.1.p1 GENE.GHVR01141734.1~~GHVR01141734.1.p1  ORF type:complete len:214 (+),score=79.18 GHVR01141734.1:45-644(+)